MQDKSIHVDCVSQTVTVNGITHEVDVPAPEENGKLLVSMHWDPQRPRLNGFITMFGDAFSVDGFARFEPYAAAWQQAQSKAEAEQEAQRKAAEDAAAALKAEAEAERAEADAMLAQAQAEFETKRPILAAQAALSSTDFKIIKAMEAKLAAEGALDPDLVAQREAARQTIRDAKE